MILLQRTVACCLLVFFLNSCGEDPELVKKHGEQKAEIARLNADLALVQERLKRLPEDKSVELEDAIAKSKELEAEREKLAADVVKLEAEQAGLQRSFDDYKRKYSIP